MRFLVDMGLAQSTVAVLCQMGHDAIHLSLSGLQRLTDSKIVEKSLQEKRIILTHDLDFGRIVALSQHHLPSVVTFRLADMRPVRVNTRLLEVLEHISDDLEAGALVTVLEGSFRVRRLPVVP
jgi:predicted nuclease of predicted toxin-antitoxin system